MNWRKATLLLVIPLFALIFLGYNSASRADEAAPGGFFVRVPATAVTEAAALNLNPLVALDYGAFQWLELSQADFDRLAASGVDFAHVPDAGQVQIVTYRFDPILDGEPALDAAQLHAGAGPALRLVQFAGPTNDSWLAEMEAAGLTPLQYYPHNAFLTWGSAAQVAQFSSRAFVRWQGAIQPAYKTDPALLERSGVIENVDVMFYNDGNIAATLAAIEALGGNVLQHYPSQPDKAFYNAIVVLDAAALSGIAGLNTVLWQGFSSPEPILDDEMSSQIVAGNHPGGVPVTGYNAHLANLGYDGTGVIWSITDTGVDYNHPDLGPYIVGGHNYPGCVFANPGDDPSSGGHGTHVAGIIGGRGQGDVGGPYTDPNGFLYGLGVAPGYSIFAQNPICGTQSSWPPAGGWQEMPKQGVLGGAIGSNNSWTTGEGTQHGYQASERTHDITVLDGNFDTTTVAEPYIHVFSAGNSGTAGLTAPKEGKNLIVTASSRNYRAGSIDDISSFSSRGPAVDGRWVPTISAPGEQIASTRNDDGGSCGTAIAGTNGLYSYCSGTSMAAPHVAGTIALTTEWWRTWNGGANPSAAMAKALVVNTAVDMGTADIPNINEGWGRINVTHIVSPSLATLYYDETHVFANTGEQWQLQIGVLDPAQPLKVTLAWSDAPGAVGANPALVNDLNLTVDTGGSTYLGNVFSSGWSAAGGAADTINNLENVYVQSPGGSATITVDAVNISGDAILYNPDLTDQSFALVCTNCALFPDFSLTPTPASLDVCAPADAVYAIDVGSILGFSDPVTLSAVNVPSGASSSFSTNPVNPPGTSDLTIGSTGSASAGSYSIDVVGVAPTSTHTTTVGLNLFDSMPGTATLQQPPDGAVDVSFFPNFQWSAASQAQTYDLEVATDMAFTNVVYTATVSGNSHTATMPLSTATTYYWRVTAMNVCGTGTTSAVFSFTTLASTLVCNGALVDFNTGIPGDWTVANNAPGNPVFWTDIAGCGEAGNYATGNGGAACASSDLQGGGSGLYDTELWTPPIDFSAYDLVELNYWAIYANFALVDFLNLDISTDGGTTWTNLLSWNEDHHPNGIRTAPGENVTVDLSAYSNETAAILRWHYYDPTGPVTSQDWYAQIDEVSLSCAAGSVDVTMAKTVGTDPATCATTDTITVPGGSDVYYCYEVTNTGTLTTTVHDLVDDRLGTILSSAAYTLAPGASVNTVQLGLQISATINTTTTNTATWTAAAGSFTASYSDTATVNALFPRLVVAPASMAGSQVPDMQVTLPLTLNNVGDADLIWTIDEEQQRSPAAPLGSGPTITATFTSAAPAIDGTVDAGEWATAYVQDISVVANPVMMYVMHDGNTLYLAFTDMNDATLDAFDQVGVYFDDEGGTPPILFDDLWTNTSCSTPNMGEGNYWLGNFSPDPDDQWREWIDQGGPTACTVQLGGTNAQIAYSAASGNMAYEIAIPLDGSSALVANEAETFGFRVYVSTGAGVFHGRFPAVSTFNDPATYGNLHLASSIAPCQPSDVPWASVNPTAGTIAAGNADIVQVTFDSTGYMPGVYTGTLCIDSNDFHQPVQRVPLTMTVEAIAQLQVAHLAPFAAGAATTVTVAIDGTPVLTDFVFADSTGYLTVPAGMHLVEIFPAGSTTPAISGTVDLMSGMDYTAIATGDGVNQPLALLALLDDNTAPAAGSFKLRLGHLAPFASGTATADVRLQDGTAVLTGVVYGTVSPYIVLPAGTYDLKITDPGGATTLIDPEPVTFNDGDIFSAFAVGDGTNQDLGVFALPAGAPGFLLPLVEDYMLYMPIIFRP